VPWSSWQCAILPTPDIATMSSAFAAQLLDLLHRGVDVLGRQVDAGVRELAVLRRDRAGRATSIMW
jgi:hypothetical protein